jgi:hypothetical protein
METDDTGGESGMNEESILGTVKKALGIEQDVDAFDEVLVMHINTALSVLAQLGAGPEDGLYITGNDVTWKQLIGENSLLSLVKTYVCQKVRLIFDPPLTSSVLDAMERSLKEMEWRILAVTDISADSGDVTECVDREARAEIAEHAVLEVNNG